MSHESAHWEECDDALSFTDDRDMQSNGRKLGEPRKFKPEESPPRGTIAPGAITGSEISREKVNSIPLVDDRGRFVQTTIDDRESTDSGIDSYMSV
ncbi:hypothetical protein HN011_012475 [Eciton burchellii]|jgi:hypothetical protein|nr:hypothetical protein HN011_012475 [Eciton burchellii]